jgi:hypothetical protein
MPDGERLGHRDLTYSQWHRANRVSRYLSQEDAWLISYVDVDGVEYCRRCNEPVALVETMRGYAGFKPATVARKLADKAGLPAFRVYYKVSILKEADPLRIATLLDMRRDAVLPGIRGDLPPDIDSVRDRVATLLASHTGVATVTFADILDTDIVEFRVQEITTSGALNLFVRGLLNRTVPDNQTWHTLQPDEYARFLVWLRMDPVHICEAARDKVGTTRQSTGSR